MPPSIHAASWLLVMLGLAVAARLHALHDRRLRLRESELAESRRFLSVA